MDLRSFKTRSKSEESSCVLVRGIQRLRVEKNDNSGEGGCCYFESPMPFAKLVHGAFLVH